MDLVAYAVSVDDAMWVLAKTVADFTSTFNDFTAFKTRFSEEADHFLGVSGLVILNINGDRAVERFDYWGLVNEGGNYLFKIIGKSN